MKEEKIVSILDKFASELISGAHAIKDFAVEQIPDVIRQAINYNIAIESFHLIAATIIGYGTYRWFKGLPEMWKKAERDNNEPLVGMATIFIVIGALAVGIWGGGSLEDLLKLTLAPKVWIIEYASKLAKH